MVIVPLAEQDCSRWDTYVRAHEHGLPQHLSGWRDVLAETYGYDTHYAIACEGDEVIGVLPLFRVRSVFAGNKVTTMPGGLCADDPEIAAELIAYGTSLGRRAGVERLVIHDSRRAWPGDLQTGDEHVSWIVDIDVDVDELWHRLDGNIRRQVRIARRNELTVEFDRTGEHVGTLYDVLSRFTHDIGTPNFGRAFLENVVATFPDGYSIAVVYTADGQPIGAYFQLEMGTTVYGTWGATLREYLDLRPVYLAYWEIIVDAVERGFTLLDMGRSRRGSGASKHKAQWGGVSVPVYQQVAPIGTASAESIAARVESDRAFRFVRRIWPRLPFPVVQFLGPRLRRHVPFG